MQSPRFFLKVSKCHRVPFVISLIFKQNRCSTCVLNKIQTCGYIAQTIRVHKNYIRLHLKNLVLTRQVLDCHTQTLALVPLMSTQNPLVLISFRGIF